MEEFDEEVVGTPAETIGGADDPHVELRDIVLDVSTNLMSAEPDEFETKLRWGLESVARGVGADRGYVFQNCEGVFECVAEWTADGDARERRRFDPEEFGWLFDRLERFENVVVPRTDELPAGATLRTALRSAGVGAAVIVPVVDSWSLEGFAGVGVRGGDRQWDETEVSLLRTVGDMVGYSL
ncbi:MAG: GAF domain-containing protein, partial [Halobacteriaceae archaeon]